MTADSIKQAFSSKPFRPMRIVTSSGDSYVVTHPDAFLITKNDLVIGLPGKGGDASELPEQIAWLSLMHITAVEPAPTSSAA